MVADFLNMVGKAGSIVINSHMRPDGDALGSSCALYFWLKERGADVKVVLSDMVPDPVRFICDGVELISFKDDSGRAAELIACADLLVCTDYNTIARSGKPAEECIRQSKATKVLFDHHLNPDTEQFDLVFSQTAISSASELVYWTLKGHNLPKRALECLMAGMTTDTNNFANSVYPSTLRMASELLEAGVDRDAIINELYNRYRPNRVKAIAWFLSNKMTLRPNGIASIIVSRQEWHELGLKDGELEGMVNIPLGIDSIKLVVYLREDPEDNFFHVSLRSKKGWSANRMAVEKFHGGGHENASGGRLYYPEDIAGPQMAEQYIDNLTL